MSKENDRELNWAGEPVPTEAEQARWSNIAAVATILLALLVFL